MTADPPVLSLRVEGHPKSQGSLRALIPRGQTQPIVVDDNAKPLREWRRAIEKAARDTWTGPPIHGGVAVNLAFHLARPQRPSNLYPIVRPDVDKLTRAVLDALTKARVWRDDCQVVQLHATKVYETSSTAPGVLIRLWTID